MMRGPRGAVGPLLDRRKGGVNPEIGPLVHMGYKVEKIKWDRGYERSILPLSVPFQLLHR